MSLKAAVDALCSLSVTGVTVFDMDSMPAGIIISLPCLIPLLNFAAPGEMGLFTTAEDGRLTTQIEHVLLVSGVAFGLPSELVYSSLAYVDNYLDALKADWRLGGTLIEPLHILGVTFGPFDYLGNVYFSVRFRHEWRIVI